MENKRIFVVTVTESFTKHIPVRASRQEDAERYIDGLYEEGKISDVATDDNFVKVEINSYEDRHGYYFDTPEYDTENDS